MTPEMEQKVLASLYDRLWDAITYSPGGNRTKVFDKQTSFVQFSKGEALRAEDFANAAAPINPGGNLNAAETFSGMVDVVPLVQADYAPGATRLSQAYGDIVRGANSNVETNPDQQKIYNQAYSYLNTTTRIKEFDGTETTQSGPSRVLNTYLGNRDAYANALSGYRLAYNSYDLNDPKQQREWQARAPALQAALDRTWNLWRGEGATQVERALAALDTTINSAVRNVLEAARQTMAQAALTSSGGGGTQWYLSYALPSNWAAPDAAENFTAITLDSSNLQSEASSRFDSYGGGASWSAGLWSVGGSAAGSSGSSSFHMSSDKLKLSAKLGLVRIYRPWLNDLIFRMNAWFVEGIGKNGISNGQLQGNEHAALPLIPTAFVVGRDISVEADFTTEDKTHVENSISGSASVGWGPFRVSGNYAHSSSKDTFKSTFDGGTLRIPGIQVLGWVSEIVPASPPLNTP
jgi:hypothetical protein